MLFAGVTMGTVFPVDRRALMLSIVSTAAPQVDTLVRVLPQKLIDQLTLDDLQRISAAIGPSRAPHIIDYRLSVPLGSQRFYFRVLCGRERRKLSRLIAEGQTNPWLVIVAAAMAFWFMMTMSLACIVVITYLVKSALGIDLFDGPSPLHRLFFDN